MQSTGAQQMPWFDQGGWAGVGLVKHILCSIAEAALLLSSADAGAATPSRTLQQSPSW